MHDFIVAIISALGGSGFATLIPLILKRKLIQRQEKQTDVQTEGIVVTTLKEAIVTLNEEVYKPIQYENKELKKELIKFTNELAKFRKAIEKIATCKYSDNCPVNRELQGKTASDTGSN